MGGGKLACKWEDPTSRIPAVGMCSGGQMDSTRVPGRVHLLCAGCAVRYGFAT